MAPEVAHGIMGSSFRSDVYSFTTAREEDLLEQVYTFLQIRPLQPSLIHPVLDLSRVRYAFSRADGAHHATEASLGIYVEA